MVAWERTTLEKCTDILGDGLHGTPKYTDNGEYAFINGNNLVNGEILIKKDTKRVDYSQYEKYKKPLTNRTLFVSINGTLGNVGMYNSEKIILGKSACYFNVKECVDKEFIYYVVSSPVFKQYLERSATGTTIKNISLKQMREYEFLLPPIEKQKQISSILKIIDGRIKNNRMINENLAVLLQTIYQEQFGDVNLVSNQGILSDICSYSREKVIVSELNVNTYFSTENMLPGKAGSIEAKSLPTTLQTTACQKGDTLISNIRPYFKKIIYCEDRCGCSADVLCFTPVQYQYAAYLFSTLYTNKFFAFMVAGAKGTKMPRGDKQQIMTYPIILPSAEALEEFNTIAFPVLEQINYNRTENKRLSSLRGALLPKLMSGELDISALNF